MNKSEFITQMRVVLHEGHMRSNDLRKGLDTLENTLVNEGATTSEAKSIVDQLVTELNPHLEGFLNTNEPQPFYDVINNSGIVGMSQNAKDQLVFNLNDGIGGRPNDRNKPSNG